MALTQNFSASQVVGQPSQVVITDTSTGVDAAVVARRVYLKTVNAIYLKLAGTATDYEAWAIANPSITLDVLDKDYCLLVRVDWLGVSGQILYTLSSLVVFKQYGDTFLYHLTQQQAGNPLLIQDKDFYSNKGKLITYLDSAVNACNLAVDQYGAQLCLDRATELRINQQTYF